MQMPEPLAATIEAFEILPDRRMKLEHLMELGETLERDESIISDANLVHGCVSQVFLAGSCDDGAMRYVGWADALIVRGFVKLLCDSFDGASPQEMIEDAPNIIAEFTQRTDIEASMIESRANTFSTLIARMRSIAENCI